MTEPTLIVLAFALGCITTAAVMAADKRNEIRALEIKYAAQLKARFYSGWDCAMSLVRKQPRDAQGRFVSSEDAEKAAKSEQLIK